jgi:hypothetical protein
MAHILLQSPVARWSGKESQNNPNGGIVLYNLGSRTIGRSYARPDNPATAPQNAMRSYLATTSAGFNTLTINQKAAWQALGASLARKDRVGQSYTLNAKQAYCMCNFYRLLDGQALTPTAPVYAYVGAVTDVQVQYITTATIAVTYTHALGAGVAKFFVRFTPNLGGTVRQARRNELRICCTSYADAIITKPTTATPTNMNDTRLGIDASWYIGCEVVSLDANYLPVGEFFSPNFITT